MRIFTYIVIVSDSEHDCELLSLPGALALPLVSFLKARLDKQFFGKGANGGS